MVKDRETVIVEFNDLVNMSQSELDDWLQEDQSQSAGWTGSSGETIGHESSDEDKTKSTNSGRRILEILGHNPSKDPSGYRNQDIDHMRRVVSYCNRHLAQEERAKHDTTSKSYRSLKNWGHDALKE
ncbi:uncharacterized protein N7511_007543 [Penicillium nucicola]|uniref:uncharacterized protein n=1 Tax=Penicillium nucicola TaxID=1850975 RepID=UPI0025456F29|nr:uncharacterized protein N7511_007543 [Penicillium nucicola]KAJ5753390.1 hypothetical protein N7511_007543 [Penicillium nucicola]